MNTPILSYANLPSQIERAIVGFHKYGYIIVQDIPNFKYIYQNFIQEARQFISLPNAEKNIYKPINYYQKGWSFGAEQFNGAIDSHKGSYYASIPDDKENNIWYSESFKAAYLSLGQLISQVGKEILDLLFIDIATLQIKSEVVGRMLYYSPIKTTSNISKYWCGVHRDHGLFTGLTPEIYFKKNKLVSKPTGSGLYIRDKAIDVDEDVLIFQIGEVLQLITNNQVTATKHHVKKAMDCSERFAFACFFEPEDDMLLNSTVGEYNERFISGMSYKEWSDASLKQYLIPKN